MVLIDLGIGTPQAESSDSAGPQRPGHFGEGDLTCVAKPQAKWPLDRLVSGGGARCAGFDASQRATNLLSTVSWSLGSVKRGVVMFPSSGR
jgi:hypothetical protein